MSRVLQFHYFCDNAKAAEHEPLSIEGDTVLVWSPRQQMVVELDICDECLTLLTLPEINALADTLGREIAEPDIDPSLVCPYGCQGGKPYKTLGGLHLHLTRRHPDHPERAE